MQSSDFDYELKDEKIARTPVSPRRAAKLLHISKPNILCHRTFEDLPEVLKELGCDGLWVNDTKVLQARLYMVKPTGGRLEIFLLEPITGIADQELAATGQSCWRCMVRGGRKWTAEKAALEVEGLKLQVEPVDVERGLEKEEGGTFLLRFKWKGEKTFGEVLDMLGRMPLPPYMKRESTDEDRDEYQTVFARVPGSVAAPTAGLHYDDVLLAELDKEGLKLSRATLHVGAGTFKPLSEGEVKDHTMHAERCVVTKATLNNLLDQKRRVATGTTTLRTLESLFWVAAYHEKHGEFPEILPQWTPFEIDSSWTYESALQYLLVNAPLDNGEWTFQTQIMIKPGYDIKSVVALITNFHQPQSTLLCLVAACLSSSALSWKDVYEVALAKDYRFLSYGDGCLIEIR